MADNCNHSSLNSLIECGGDCAKLLAAPRYWVRTHGGYPDDPSAYLPANSKRECAELGLVDLGYLENPCAFVYRVSRDVPASLAPWLEVDPYPDFVVEFGPRGGIRWDIA